MAFDFSTLVTDRTQQDVAYAKQLIDKLVTGTATDAEKDKWNSFTLKGAYNHTDLNRVTAAMEDLKARLEGYGYAVTNYNRLEVLHASQDVLPKGYIKLAYVESSGTQFIDTGFVPNQDSSIEIVVSFAAVDNTCVIFGSARDYNSTAFESYVWNSRLQLNYGNNGMSYFEGIVANKEHILAIRKNTVSVTYPDGKVIPNTVTYSDFTTPNTMKLFALHRDTVACGKVRIHAAKLYDDDKLIHSYIPCINSVGDVGLYDVVTKTFCANSGTGVFIAGTHLVELPSGYTRVEYIESSGTQFVDTLFTPTNISKFKFAMDVAFTAYKDCIYGDGNTYIGFYGDNQSTVYAMAGGGLGENTSIKFNTNKHAFILDCVNRQGSIDGVVTSCGVGSVAFKHPFYLFGWHTDRYNSSRLYSAQLYYDGVLVRHYVPCIHPSGEVGLYDLIMATFYGNNGTGVFTSGTPTVELPDGYTQVDYIASTGTQYIDTEFKPNQDSRLTMDIDVATGASSGALFASRESNMTNYFGVFIVGATSVRSDYGTNLATIDNVTISGRSTLDKNKNVLTFKGKSATNSTAVFSGTQSIYLLTANTGGTASAERVTAKVYSCQIYDNGTTVRNFIPCINPSGEVGLYDTVTKKFYRNQGTGVFTAGSKPSALTLSTSSHLNPFLWYEFDYPTQEAMKTYLGNVSAIRDTLSVLETTPHVPESMSNLTVQEANAIEQILFDVEKVIYQIVNGFPRNAAFTFWSGHRPFPSATNDIGRTWEELDAMQTTWGNWQVADWYLLLYGNLKAEGVIE